MFSADVWLSYTGCGSHGSIHSKGIVGKMGWSADSQSIYSSAARAVIVLQPMLIMTVIVQLLIDLEEVMNMGYESNSNHNDNIPASIDEVIRAINPVAWLDNPLPRPQHVVTDNYSPASPVYSPDHSPIQIDSDEEEVESRASMAPAPLEMPIVTPANDIFESDNSDSDLDFERET